MMGWLTEIWTTLVEAFTARQVFVTASIGAAASLVVTFVPRIFHGELLGVPAWAWGLIVWLAGLLWFALAYAHRKRVALVPVIELSFDPEECVVVTPKKFHFLKNGFVTEINSEATYIRIKITAPKTAVKDCVAFITALEKLDRERSAYFEMPVHAPISLKQEPVTVYSYIPRFLDVLWVDKLDNVVHLPEGSPLSLAGKLQDQTIYRFTIRVVGGDVTKTIKILVTWPGRWNGISATSAH